MYVPKHFAEPDADAIAALVAAHDFALLVTVGEAGLEATHLPLLFEPASGAKGRLIGHVAHNRGPRSWHIEGAGVQGYNVPYCGLITMGEAWHNNHHAFPASARLGIGRGEADPGWWVLCGLRRTGLVWGVKTPDMLPHRPNLVELRE